jgi:pyridoxal phosphate enzyme (YggS family)
MLTELEFKKNLEFVQEQIGKACDQAGRKPTEVHLLPVTKNWPSEIITYCKNAGFDTVGENRVQEAAAKQEAVSGMNWELIGHLQSNKAKNVVGKFSRIQTVDSEKLIRKLEDSCSRNEMEMKILLQVNAGEDPAKFGCSLEGTARLLAFALSQKHIRVEGLMTIAPYAPEDLDVARSAFAKLRNLRDRLRDEFNVELNELSMGMTLDLEQAIEAGSTMIRVGSALFGNR